MKMMVGLKMQFEMARLMQEFESVQLAIAYALGGKVEKNAPSRQSTYDLSDAQELRTMDQLMSAFHTIGGKIGS